MNAAFSQLLPIFAWFALGVVLRKTAVAEASHAQFLLRLALLVTLPLLIVTTLPTAGLTADKAVLPLINIGVNLACMFCAYTASRYLQLDRQRTGTMLINTMITNNAFMFPFILAVYGDRGFADAILYDFGNAVMVATYAYSVALKYGGETSNRWLMLRKVVFSPLFLALVLAIWLSATGAVVPQAIESVITPLAQMTSPLILVSLGIYFTLKIEDLKLVSLAVLIRMVLGLGFGIALATLLGLEGQTFTVVVLCTGAPIGFMALSFSAMARLDTRLSASAVSISILAGLFYIPLLMAVF